MTFTMNRATALEFGKPGISYKDIKPQHDWIQEGHTDGSFQARLNFCRENGKLQDEWRSSENETGFILKWGFWFTEQRNLHPSFLCETC